ncbi:MAG: MBL fold metallo-hydrolase [Acidimicrobiia bacterium]|nr:MBL fold metallo-hydrolase [Acidimicrobiia bacterium]
MKEEAAPASPDSKEVASGVIRVQLPINFTGLGHTNMYVLEDDRGAAVIDTGLPGRAAWAAIRRGLDAAGVPIARVHTIMVTHSHPDHFGNAARLAAESGAELLTHKSFQIWWTLDNHSEIDEDELARHAEARAGRMPWHGASQRRSAGARARGWWMRNVGHRMYRIPTPTRRLIDGEELQLGRRTLQAVHTPGHTADHLCWFDPESGVLFSGDHVLPTITPHIAGIGAGADPLADYVASLDKAVALPGVGLVLPAHGDPIVDLARRAASIKHHHEERLDQLRQIVATSGPMSVEILAEELFPKRSWGFMAESETFAHIEHLRFLGEVDRATVDGRVVFGATHH